VGSKAGNSERGSKVERHAPYSCRREDLIGVAPGLPSAIPSYRDFGFSRQFLQYLENVKDLSLQITREYKEIK
jgi:hypothetical protein